MMTKMPSGVILVKNLIQSDVFSYNFLMTFLFIYWRAFKTNCGHLELIKTQNAENLLILFFFF